MVTALQRTSSNMRLNPHLHLVALDGAYHEAGEELVSRPLSRLKTWEVGEVLERAVADGQIPEPLDREAAATGFIGLIQGLVMQSMLNGRPGAMRAQARRVFALYASGLGVSR